MSNYSKEYTCRLVVANGIAKPDVMQWIHEFSVAVLDNYLSSGNLPDHFEGNDLEIPTNHEQAVALIVEEIWHYVRWCESNRADNCFIIIQCEDDSVAADADWILEIAQFLANKTANLSPNIR